MNKYIDFRENIYLKDINYWDTIIVPKLESEKKVSVFCAFTYITPNYMVIHTIQRLVKLAKLGCTIIITIWDNNILPHKTGKFLRTKFNTEQELIDNILNSIKNIAIEMGIPEEKLIINKISDIWKRLTIFSKPNIFSQYYTTMMNFKSEELIENSKISHLIQMPMDVFMTTYYHLLYPEHISEPIDILIGGTEKTKVYEKTRNKMKELDFLKFERPIIMTIKKIPYIIYQDLIPEWDMSLDEIKYIILNAQPTDEDIIQLIHEVISPTLKNITTFSNNKQKTVNKETFLKEFKKLTREEKMISTSINLKSFLEANKVKEKKIKFSNKPHILIDKKDKTISLSKILKSKTFIETLKACDGRSNISEIARKTKKQIANTSNYLKELNRQKLIELNSEGYFYRTINSVTIDLTRIIEFDK